MNMEVILLMISASFSVGVFIGVVKISWMQDDIKTEIREIKNKLNSL
jgi:Mg2+/citrate symporter